MKVAVLGLRGIPNVMGGVETHCEQLYPRIRVIDPDLDLTVLARAPYVPAGPADYRGVNVRPLPAPRSVYFEAIAHTLIGLVYARFRLRADLVHVHAIGPGLVSPVAKLLGLKVVFTHHGEDYRRDKWNGFARFVLRAGEDVAILFSDRVVSVSRSVAQALAARYPARAGRIRFVPNGAGIAGGEGSTAPDAAVLARYGLEPGRFIMTVARLVPEKGVHDLIDAFEKAADSLGDMKLVVVGSSQTRTPYADALLARASDRVVFTGALPRADIVPLYAQAALFVLASSHEGLPIVALEALSMGGRVLLSDIVPNKDLDLPAAHYFPVGQVDALARRLAHWSDIPSGDRDSITARYDWNAIASTTAAIFREAARPPTARA